MSTGHAGDPPVMPPAPTDVAAVTGVVLAGGLARRMQDAPPATGPAPGGVDKGLQPFRGRPMAEHVIARLAPQVARVVINANRNHDAWRRFGLPVFGDEIGGFAGPLAGLHAAMGVVDTPWLVTVPCDSPFLPDDLVRRLARAAVERGARVATASAGGRAQPVFALVDRALRPALATYLAAGWRKIDRWFAEVAAVEVEFDDERAFRNINTPQDLRRYEDDPC